MWQIREKNILAVFLISALCSLICPTWAAGSTYYVDVNTAANGDARSCSQATSLATPKKTLNNAAACLTAGDTLWVRGGTYVESLESAIPSGTSWTHAVTIKNYNGETVILRPNAPGPSGYMVCGKNQDQSCNSVMQFTEYNGQIQQYIIIDGLILDGSNVTGDAVNITYQGSDIARMAHHIRFINTEIGNAPLGSGVFGGNYDEFINSKIYNNGNETIMGVLPPPHGFYLAGSYNLIEGCDIYGHNSSQSFGIQLQYNFAAGNIVRNNRIHDNRNGMVISAYVSSLYGGDGTATHDNIVYNNVIYNNVIDGIANGSWGPMPSYNNKVLNNTIYGNGNYGVRFSYTYGSLFQNNILYGNGADFYDELGQMGLNTITNNLCGAVGIGCAKGGDPRFVNASARDFHLQSNSPAINAGVTTSLFTTDTTGGARTGAYDIGAYEYASGGAGSPVVGLSPASLSFGNVAVGAPSQVQYVTVSNTGNATLNLSDVVFAGDFAPAGLGTCGTSVPVASGTSCTISVVFTPAASGARTGSITLTDNASPSTQIINLSGTGSSSSACDVNQDGAHTVPDVQLAINQVLGMPACVPFGQSGSADINHDGQCTVVDVQRVVNAALGGSCVSP